MGKTKKASYTIADDIEQRVKKFNKAKYRERSVDRIKDEMKIHSEAIGKPFRNIDLAHELGMKDGSLVSKWFGQSHAEIKDYHLQRMAELFHVEKSWLDGSGNARVHEAYNSVIEKTGLTEEAIDMLIENRKLDRSRIDKYTKLVDATKENDVLVAQNRPIPKATIVSGIITHKKFPAVCSLLESIANEMPKEAKGHYSEYAEVNDSPQTWTLRKNLEKILLDCIDDLI